MQIFATEVIPIKPKETVVKKSSECYPVHLSRKTKNLINHNPKQIHQTLKVATINRENAGETPEEGIEMEDYIYEWGCETKTEIHHLDRNEQIEHSDLKDAEAKTGYAIKESNVVKRLKLTKRDRKRIRQEQNK